MIGHITDPNAPAGLDLRDLPEPTAAPSDVVVDVRAYAINRGELHLLQLRPNGWTPGQDVAGVVVTAAADGTGPKPGTRVVAAADQGGWSERVAVPSYRVAAIPDNVSFADAAALPVAGLTALRALRTGGPLLGRFDLVLDGVGGPVLVDALHHLAPGGTVAAYGMASGEKSPIAFTDFRAATDARLVGFFVYQTDVATFGEDLGFMAGLIGAGRLNVPGPRRDWKETRQAIDLVRRREATGKVVLTIG